MGILAQVFQHRMDEFGDLPFALVPLHGALLPHYFNDRTLFVSSDPQFKFVSRRFLDQDSFQLCDPLMRRPAIAQPPRYIAGKVLGGRHALKVRNVAVDVAVIERHAELFPARSDRAPSD